MAQKSTEVGAFEAKTRLSQLLRETERGGSFVILRRGKPVARLLPPVAVEQGADLVRIVRELREIRGRARGPVKVRRLIEQGRRF